jgi:hypothetical protein
MKKFVKWAQGVLGPYVARPGGEPAGRTRVTVADRRLQQKRSQIMRAKARSCDHTLGYPSRVGNGYVHDPNMAGPYAQNTGASRTRTANTWTERFGFTPRMGRRQTMLLRSGRCVVCGAPTAGAGTHGRRRSTPPSPPVTSYRAKTSPRRMRESTIPVLNFLLSKASLKDTLRAIC